MRLYTLIIKVYFWAALSDRIGRKPVIMIGGAGAAIFSLTFGLSRSLASLVVSRMLAGALMGNIAVISSMTSELTDANSQGQGTVYTNRRFQFGSNYLQRFRYLGRRGMLV